MYDSNGTISGVIATFTDLTEMSRMRQEIMRQDRMAAVGELAAGLAHEIRNPVAVIRGAADEMLRYEDDAAVQKRLRTMIMRESDQLNGIVTGFLDFAREPLIRRERLNVGEVIADVRESLMQEAHNGTAKWQIELRAPDHPCVVSGDHSQLRQVFVNLGKNALEAMESGGTLVIAVDGGNGGPVRIRFEDQGPGIDPDKVAQIFEPFYTTKRTGVGMGLAICARILTAHDGTIRATSRAGGGCSMNITLPAVTSPEESLRE
jgi:signal transduction histidine kinase